MDTSCIDKASSTELSEAINSMFAWYRDAAVCYAYLADVLTSGDPRRPGSAFRYSRWFTHGWTLQELIAPRIVVFLSREWDVIGTKESLADLIEDITGIDCDVLTHRKSHNDISVAARMSWAAQRITTRVEDHAYCLLGIFNIVMHPIYGEGEHAFIRLQEEILRRIPDDSIFAWESHVYDTTFVLPSTSSPSGPNASVRDHANNPIHVHYVVLTVRYRGRSLETISCACLTPKLENLSTIQKTARAPTPCSRTSVKMEKCFTMMSYGYNAPYYQSIISWPVTRC